MIQLTKYLRGHSLKRIFKHIFFQNESQDELRLASRRRNLQFNLPIDRKDRRYSMANPEEKISSQPERSPFLLP